MDPVPPVVPLPEPKNKVWLWIVGGVLLLGVGIVGGVFLGKQLYSKPVSQPTPSPVAETTPTPDITANWKTYINSVHNVSFNYPFLWSLTEDSGQSEGGKIYNTKVELSKGNVLITMYLNLNGIGGRDQTYEGKRFVLDGHNLYQFNKVNSYNNTKEVGISDSLTTLGVFKVNNIVYSITVAYPADYKKLAEENILKEFNQILSTFKFLD